MRDAVTTTGREIKKLNEWDAMELGYFTSLKHLLFRGRLKYNQEWLCRWAAIHRQLEVLQWLHANGIPWTAETCSKAAQGGHLEMLQWARANGCPWNNPKCIEAAILGYFEID